MKKLLTLVLVLQMLVMSAGFAAEEGGSEEDDIVKNTQNDVLLVAGAGLAGAVLGLSTLSFVDKPSKHISNIWTGAAIGIIAGVIFVAYNSAQKSSEDLESSAEFNSSERYAWHDESVKPLTSSQVLYGTQFWQASF